MPHDKKDEQRRSLVSSALLYEIARMHRRAALDDPGNYAADPDGPSGSPEDFDKISHAIADEILAQLPPEFLLRGLSPRQRLEGLSAEQVVNALPPPVLATLEQLNRQRQANGPGRETALSSPPSVRDEPFQSYSRTTAELFPDMDKAQEKDPEGPKSKGELLEFALRSIVNLVKGLSPEERLKGLSMEQRLAGLSPVQILEGLSSEELRRALEAAQRRRQEDGPSGTPS